MMAAAKTPKKSADEVEDAVKYIKTIKKTPSAKNSLEIEKFLRQVAAENGRSSVNVRQAPPAGLWY